MDFPTLFGLIAALLGLIALMYGFLEYLGRLRDGRRPPGEGRRVITALSLVVVIVGGTYVISRMPSPFAPHTPSQITPSFRATTNTAPQGAHKGAPTDSTFSSSLAKHVIYVGSQDHNVYALRADNGSLLWHYQTGSSILSSPAILNEVVFIGSDDHYLYALRASDGSLLWRYRTGDSVESAIVAINDTVYVGSNDHYLYALRVSDGSLLWRFRAVWYVFSQPRIANDILYFSSANQLYALQTGDGTLVWSKSITASEPTVVNGVVYVGSNDGYIYELHATDGSIIRRHPGGDSVYPSPAVVDGVVYGASRDGSHNDIIYAWRANDNSELWSSQAGGNIFSITVADSIVYCGSDDHRIYAFQASNGDSLWSYQTNDQVVSSPIVVDGIVFLGSQDHYIYALRANNGSLLWRYQTGDSVSSPVASP